MKSLRRQLLLSLWLAVLLVGAISAVLAYYKVNGQAKDLLDSQLVQTAAIVTAQKIVLPHTVPSDDSDIEVAVWRADGTLQYASSTLLAMPFIAQPGFSERRLGTEPYRIYTATTSGLHVEVAQPVDTREDQAEGAAIAALLPMLLLLPALALVIALVIRALLHPLRAVAAAISRRDPLASEKLDVRALPSEIVPLVDEINRLLERQNEAIRRETQFLLDAAHALRTPLAALQLQADVLDGSPDSEERRARLVALRAGIQRAAQVSERLLSFARAESGTLSGMETVNLESIVQEVYSLYEGHATESRIGLTLHLQGNAWVRGDQRQLLLVCSNLLDNALRHTPAGGVIQLRTSVIGRNAELEIWDEGPGLPTDQIERVFERFYRVPGDDTSGTGLGLATVASVIKQLDGQVSLRNRTDRSGLIARVVLQARRVPYNCPTGARCGF